MDNRPVRPIPIFGKVAAQKLAMAYQLRRRGYTGIIMVWNIGYGWYEEVGFQYTEWLRERRKYGL